MRAEITLHIDPASRIPWVLELHRPGRVFKVRADEVEILSEPAARWADLFGAAPNYTGGVPVDEWLEAHRGEA